MAAAQYKKCFKEMIEENQDEFNNFQKIHDKFAKNPQKYRAKYNLEGEKIVDIIRKYESILCGRSEGSGYGNYTSSLADKFWNLVRGKFSEIDEIGIT